MTRRIVAAAFAAVIIGGAAGSAAAQPPSSTPAMPPTSTQQLTPQSPGNGGGTEQIPVQDPKSGGVRWDEFGGDPVDAPRDLDSFITDVLGWMRTGAGVAAVLGGLMCAGLIFTGIRGRSEQAKRALSTLPAVLGGTILAGAATTVLSIFL